MGSYHRAGTFHAPMHTIWGLRCIPERCLYIPILLRCRTEHGPRLRALLLCRHLPESPPAC